MLKAEEEKQLMMQRIPKKQEIDQHQQLHKKKKTRKAKVDLSTKAKDAITQANSNNDVDQVQNSELLQ